MTLPFTVDQFFHVFRAYNTLLWPMALLFWLATALTVLVCMNDRRAVGATAAALLAIQWLWAGAVYHAGFFTAVNPAAWLFAALFIAEGVLLTWYGVVQRRFRMGRLSFGREAAVWTLLAYALLYPLLAASEGHLYPDAPTFGIPCPTTILTIGFLVAADDTLPRSVAIIPLVWAFIGGTAAFLLDVRTDLVLIAAGAALIVDLIVRSGALHAHRPHHA